MPYVHDVHDYFSVRLSELMFWNNNRNISVHQCFGLWNLVTVGDTWFQIMPSNFTCSWIVFGDADLMFTYNFWTILYFLKDCLYHEYMQPQSYFLEVYFWKVYGHVLPPMLILSLGFNNFRMNVRQNGKKCVPPPHPLPPRSQKFTTRNIFSSSVYWGSTNVWIIKLLNLFQFFMV